MASSDETKNLNVNEKLILIVIILIAFLLRIYKLDYKSIWLDEGLSTWIASHSNFIQLLNETSFSRQNPLFSIVLHFWISIFGKSEFFIRLPNVVFSLGLVYMAFRIGVLLYSNQVGILSSLLLTISVFHINHTQEARPYTLSSLLALISVYFYIKLIEEGNFKYKAGYLISSILLVYNHMIGFFIIIAQNIYLLILKLTRDKIPGINLKSWIKLQLLILVIFLPWIIKLYRYVNPSLLKIRPLAGGIPDPSLMTVMDTFIYCFSGSLILATIFIALIAWNLSSRNKRSLFLLLFFLTPLLAMYLISKLYRPIYLDRYNLINSSFFYILIAAGLTGMNKYFRTLIISSIIILSLLNIRTYHINSFPFTYRETNWREAVKVIDNNATNSDLLIFDAWYNKRYLFDYYSRRNDLTIKYFQYEPPRLMHLISIPELEPYFKKHKRVWLITFHPKDKGRLIENRLREIYKINKEWKYNENDPFDKLDIKLFEAKV